MSKYQMYTSQALECERAAAKVADDSTRKSLLDLAWRWRLLADEEPADRRVGKPRRFHDDAEAKSRREG